MSSNVQKKLVEFSETPPASAWEGIVAALEGVPAYAQKLQTYETAPPAGVWDKVALQLTAPPAKIIPLRTKLFKYAIAAAVLVAVAAGSIFYLTHTTGPNLAGQSNKTSTEIQKNTLANTELPSKTTSGQNQENTTENSNDLNANAITESTLLPFASRVHIGKWHRMPARQLKIKPEEKNIINTALADRYMIATTSAGTVVRLPKKAYSAYACADAYGDTYCKEKIASIQSKMAASVSTDFTDLMDLLKNLQDN